MKDGMTHRVRACEVVAGVAAVILLVLVFGGRPFVRAQQRQSTFTGGTPSRSNYEGDVKWLEPVQDTEYLAPPKK